MRRTALGITLAAAVLSLFGCRDADNPVQPQGPEIVPPPALDIVDGSSDGGNPGILFRLPIKVAGRVPGTFDPSVPLRMEIRELGSDASPEEYTVAAGDIDVREHLRSYILWWRPPDHAPSGTIYRVSLYAGALDLLAWADLEVAYRVRDALRIVAKGDNALLLGQLDRYPISVYVNTEAVPFAEARQAEALEEEPGVVDASVTLIQNDEGGSGEVFNTADPDAPLAAQVTTQPGQAVDASGNPVSDYVLTMVLHENDYDPLPGVSPNFQFPFFFTGSATTSTGEPVTFTTVNGQVGAEVLICQPLTIHAQLPDPQLNAQKIFQYDPGSTQLHETAVGDPRCAGYQPPQPVQLSLGPGLAHDLLLLGRRGLRRMTALVRPTPLIASHGGLRTLPSSGAINLSDWGAVLATDPAVSTATVPDGAVGSPTAISIQAMVETGVPQILGGDQVQVGVSGANSATLTVGDGVTDNGDGTYTATYTPTAGGTDQVAITIVEPETGAPVPIAGSPFTSTVVDASAFLADVHCEDRFGVPSACTVTWFIPAADTVDIGVGGASISLLPNVPITLSAVDPYGVFTGTVTVQGSAGDVTPSTISLVGQGGEFCGGTPASMSLVTVVPNSGCPGGGTVSSPQEAILLVQDGGEIQFAGGTHQAMSLNVPRSDLTMSAVPGQSPVILSGSGDPTGYDGPAFTFVGSGDFTVRDLTFRGYPVGPGGVGFITGPNSVNAAGSYSSFTVDNVRFENLRIGLAVTPSSSPGALAVVRNSTFLGTSPAVNSNGLVVISNASGSPSVVVEDNTFDAQSNPGVQGILLAAFAGPGGATPSSAVLTATGNQFTGLNVAVNGTLGTGSLISSNTFQNPTTTGSPIAFLVGADPGATASLEDNVVTGTFSGGDPTDPANYTLFAGFRLASFGSPGTLQVARNSVSGAFEAVETDGSVVVAASDFVIDQVHVVLQNSTTGSVTLQSSDITNFGLPYAAAQPLSAGALTCNWWGDAAGPAPGSTNDPIWTPWAIAPVANGAGGACTGS